MRDQLVPPPPHPPPPRPHIGAEQLVCEAEPHEEQLSPPSAGLHTKDEGPTHAHQRRAVTLMHTHQLARVHTQRGGESEGLFTLLKRVLIELFKDPGGGKQPAPVCLAVHAWLCA